MSPGGNGFGGNSAVADRVRRGQRRRMAASDAAGDGKPASLRDLAREAGVSAMTVSKALRNAPKIAPATRAKILRIARQHGYRPDPEVARLMHHLRARTKPAFQGLICAITDRLNEENHPFIRAMLDAARYQAERRGFAFSYLHFREHDDDRRRLRRLLWSRSARGVVLLPLEQPTNLGALLAWNEIAAVAATSSVLGPNLHRVMPSHYANTLSLCDQLWQKGYRRIGLVIGADHDSRVNHAFSAAILWHQYRYAGRIVVPPLIHDATAAPGLRAWFRRTKPDAIVMRDAVQCRTGAAELGLPLGGRVGFACTYAEPTAGCAGIDECPGEIAASAVDRLAAMIQHGERGLPDVPTLTLVSGKWLEGASCPGAQTSAQVRSALRRTRAL